MVRTLSILALLLVLPLLVLAQGPGKVSGSVVDEQSGEPLIGANVVIQGTSLGASTDLEGDFVILNVPPGSYSLSVSYVGYNTLTMSNVIVNSELTTTVNVKLQSAAVTVPTVEIVAERPLVQKDATNAIHQMRGEDIQRIPTRGYLDVVALQPGAVRIGNTLYVRGGRSDEVAYFIDGMIVNNPFNSTNAGSVVNESIEEVTYQAGGFNAEYGFANAGLVSTTTKSGGADYSVSAGFLTDYFLPLTNPPRDPLQRILEGRKGPESLMSYGHATLHASVGGPIPGTGKKVKFHLGGQFVEDLDGDPSAGRNYYLPKNKSREYALNSNVTLDYQPFNVRLGGFSSILNDRIFSNYHSIFNQDRMQKRERSTHAYYAKLTQTIGTNTYYSAMASWFQTETEQGDPVWWDDVDSYGDPVKNPILAGPGRNPPNVFHNLFAGKGYVNFAYNYNKSSYLSGKLDVSHQSGNHLLKVGGEYRYNTIRYWTVSTTFINLVKSSNPSLNREAVLRNSYTNNLGMTVQGVSKGSKTELDDESNPNSAPHPIVAAAYVQDKIELEDLVLNLGLRMDYINANVKKFRDPLDIVLVSNPAGYTDIDPSNYVEGDANITLSPRFGFSFPVTDQTVFHAQYGHFVQHVELNRLYTSTTVLAQQLSAGNYVNVGNPGLRPEKTITYEVGFSQQLGGNASLDITAYYKDIQDLIQLENQLAKPVQYALFVNGDYGTVKGLSLAFELRRTERVSAMVNYTLQYANGTGSAATSNFNIAWLGGNFPTFVSPLDFDQRHTGSINVDFRTLPDDGPLVGNHRILGQVGINMLFTFGSGRPYTPSQPKGIIFGPSWAQPTSALNQTYSPWNFQLDMKVDKTFRLGPTDVNVYLWALNVLNTKNVVSVYNFSGLPDDDGYFKTTGGQAYADREGPEAVEGYRYRLGNPENWGTPRQLRLGVRVDL